MVLDTEEMVLEVAKIDYKVARRIERRIAKHESNPSATLDRTISVRLPDHNVVLIKDPKKGWFLQGYNITSALQWSGALRSKF